MQIGDILTRKNEQLPQFDYLFRVDLPSINSSGFSTEFPVPGASRGFSDSNDISHRVYSVNAPLREYEVKKNTKSDQFMYSITTSDIGTISMRIDEYEDGRTLEYLLAWQDLIGNSIGKNPPAVYKGNIRVIRMSSVLSDVHVHYYRGFVPNNISPMGFSYDNNGILQYEVTFVGDDVEHLLISAGQVKSAIQGLQNEIVGSGSGSGETTGIVDSSMDKIRTTFKPTVDQIAGVVNSIEQFPNRVEDYASDLFGRSNSKPGTDIF